MHDKLRTFPCKEGLGHFCSLRVLFFCLGGDLEKDFNLRQLEKEGSVIGE